MAGVFDFQYPAFL